MRILSSILGAVFVTAVYYSTVYVIDQKRELSLRKKANWLTEPVVLLIGIVTFCMLLWLGIGKGQEITMPNILLQYILLWGMSILAVTDYKKHVISNRILLIMLMLWGGIIGIYTIMETEYGLALFFQSLAGGLAGGLIFLLCYLLSKRQLGAGDVKLAFVMGLYLTGQRIIGAVFYGILLCFFYSVVQLLRKKIGIKDGVPLTPFLYMGVLFTMVIMF